MEVGGPGAEIAIEHAREELLRAYEKNRRGYSRDRDDDDGDDGDDDDGSDDDDDDKS